ncbi:hypothetical protein PsorP6_003224 [Peronosclerospora sorghi]|uniref:Uncharacterized protein n=1 Tax=Peronosclerospora sorghi TaxID=230839 RepID=A0ACC0VR17_9STRA|nr:hypothetical protein PsorP6_003224 [Peronosclerospora sorghi]
MTCVRYPLGIGAAAFFLPKVVKPGVSVAGGFHKAINTENFRIGHMGSTHASSGPHFQTLEAMEGAFIECGHTVPHGGKAARD